MDSSKISTKDFSLFLTCGLFQSELLGAAMEDEASETFPIHGIGCTPLRLAQLFTCLLVATKTKLNAFALCWKEERWSCAFGAACDLKARVQMARGLGTCTSIVVRIRGLYGCRSQWCCMLLLHLLMSLTPSALVSYVGPSCLLRLPLWSWTQ